MQCTILSFQHSKEIAMTYPKSNDPTGVSVISSKTAEENATKLFQQNVRDAIEYLANLLKISKSKGVNHIAENEYMVHEFERTINSLLEMRTKTFSGLDFETFARLVLSCVKKFAFNTNNKKGYQKSCTVTFTFVKSTDFINALITEINKNQVYYPKSTLEQSISITPLNENQSKRHPYNKNHLTKVEITVSNPCFILESFLSINDKEKNDVTYDNFKVLTNDLVYLKESINTHIVFNESNFETFVDLLLKPNKNSAFVRCAASFVLYAIYAHFNETKDIANTIKYLELMFANINENEVFVLEDMVLLHEPAVRDQIITKLKKVILLTRR